MEMEMELDKIYCVPKFIDKYKSKSLEIKPKIFTNTFVLFADIVGFTQMLNESKDPIYVYNLLNNLFIDFDKLCEEFLVHKVETIGDCYMCISNLYQELNSNRCLIDFSIKMLEIVKSKYSNISIRIGISYGSVLMGMLGNKNTKVCFVGTCINLSARLQNKAIINSILVCENTYKLNSSNFEFLKEINDIKGFGKLNNYHLIKQITNYNYNYNYNLNINQYNFRKNILIIDDSMVTVKIMKKKIQMLANLNIDYCNSINDMIDRLIKYNYDAIILDYHFSNSDITGLDSIDRIEIIANDLFICIFSGKEIKTDKLFIKKPWSKSDFDIFLSKI